MLPDAAYRLKWVYGVEAFQRWAKLRNQPILTAAPEGKIKRQKNVNLQCFFSFRSGNCSTIFD